MTKVYCKKYQEELPALDRPPYPGPRGEEIFNNDSKKYSQRLENFAKRFISTI